MTRKKVNLVWIVNDNARKASFKKRKVGLMKKVSELTILCGVNATAIVYGPDDKEPVVWPSRPAAKELLARFHSMPDLERGKKMMNKESYLKERSTKVHELFQKHHRKNKEIEMTQLMHQIFAGKRLDEFEVAELQGVAWLLEEKFKEMRKCMNLIPPMLQEQDPPVPPEPFPFDQWFLEMMQNNENSAAGSSNNTAARSAAEIRMMQPPHGYGGGDMGLLQLHRGGGGSGSMGLRPPQPYASDMRRHGNIGGGGGYDMGILLHGNIGGGSGIGVGGGGGSNGVFGGAPIGGGGGNIGRHGVGMQGPGNVGNMGQPNAPFGGGSGLSGAGWAAI